MRTHLVAAAVVVAAFGSHAFGQSFSDAVENGNVELVRERLANGFDVNYAYENGRTPVYFARDLETLEVLLDAGADLAVRERASGQSPLEAFAERAAEDGEERAKWTALVAKLKAAGADYTFDAAILLNDVAAVRAALERDRSFATAGDGRGAPLRTAARFGYVGLCKLLIEHGADVNGFDEGLGFPILHAAIDRPETLKLLLDRGANVRRRITYDGGRTGVWLVGDEATALHYAVAAGNLQSVKTLLEAGLDPTAADEEGQTPLHIAVRFEAWEEEWGRDASEYVPIVEYLVAQDASLRFRDRRGRTPLERAEEADSSEAIRAALRGNTRDCKERPADEPSPTPPPAGE